MFQQWLFTIIVASSCLFSSYSLAADLSPEESKLNDLQQKLEALTTQQEQLKFELISKKEKLIPLNAENSPEQKKLAEAKKALEKAIADQVSNPGPQSEGPVKNARLKVMLAERKFKRANSEQFELQSAVENIEYQLQQLGPEIEELKASINEQRTTVQKALTEQLSSSKKQQQKQADAAAAEIARLKAELAAKEAAAKKKEQALLEQQRKAEAEAKSARAEAQSAKAKAKQAQAALEAKSAPAATPAPPAPSPAKAVPAVPSATAKPATTPNTAAPATSSEKIEMPKAAPVAKPAVEAPEAAVAKPAPSPTAATPASSGPGVILLTSAEAVKAEKDALVVRLSTDNGGRKKGYNRILNVKPVVDGKANTQTQAFQLRALGNDQYRGVAELSPGENIFFVGPNRWRQVVPENAESNRYMVMFDSSDKKNPRLVYFHESLSTN